MKTGFSHEVAPELVRAQPGNPPEYYALLALKRGLTASDSKNPVFSLASTLRKEIREGRLSEVTAVRQGGRLCLFPSDMMRSPKQGTNLATPISAHMVTVNVAANIVEIADLLVDVGVHPSRARAIGWMAEEWARNSENYIAKAREAAARIGSIRASLSSGNGPASAPASSVP